MWHQLYVTTKQRCNHFDEYSRHAMSFVYESSSYYVIRGEARGGGGGGGDGVLFYTHLYLAGSERLINRF